MNSQLLSFFFYLNFPHIFPIRAKNTILNECFSLAEHTLPLKRIKPIK
ncbi:hypothetical protein M135_4839 [Bacteroides fragilis str. S36L5]|uniref:Uncharacterized protein n=1 Tax=Bacteroides fragilis str. S36L11 TaxID=1339327 RepID=A0A015WXE7_BACFG|nr:hypothetical protein M071_3902 [Bacteroides fragilis str. Ds-233]EXZ26580.1 hypothetical protein M136_4295 [Bacteroides fragilis str. S36L11]EXZ46996.1 hypothetical protein M109_4176 [Bacteroides fragilis str. 3397 N2]EXZ51828.1 hypothetical protein M108_4205 [Bacteroides fragilis str. 3397 T14]EYA41745.1 hypothetical protein M110_4279 [Bacteroides fragilis str. 3397 N3]EYA83000.1 hypothetical protein M137_5343 [Bacteroides fragilis str. S36L12]EYA88650.1 hypothetical protein M135_4839 [Ba